MVLDHVQQRIKYSWRERNRRSIHSLQSPLRGVDPEATELVDVTGVSLHCRSE
jgi:hypothetical protein